MTTTAGTAQPATADFDDMTDHTEHTHECRDCGGSIYCWAEDYRDCKEPICRDCDEVEYLSNPNTAV